MDFKIDWRNIRQESYLMGVEWKIADQIEIHIYFLLFNFNQLLQQEARLWLQ